MIKNSIGKSNFIKTLNIKLFNIIIIIVNINTIIEVYKMWFYINLKWLIFNFQ